MRCQSKFTRLLQPEPCRTLLSGAYRRRCIAISRVSAAAPMHKHCSAERRRSPIAQFACFVSIWVASWKTRNLSPSDSLIQWLRLEAINWTVSI